MRTPRPRREVDRTRPSAREPGATPARSGARSGDASGSAPRCSIAEELPPEPAHGRLGQMRAGAVLAIGRGVEGVVSGRVEEHLQREARVRGRARGARRPRRGAHPRCRRRRRAAPKRSGRPSGRRPCVLDSGRVAVLGGEAVLDGDDRDAGPRGQRAAEPVVRFEAADDPAAAVEVDECAGPAPAGR